MDKYYKLLRQAQWALDNHHPGRLGWAVRRLRRFSGQAYRLGTEAAQAIIDGPLDGGQNMKAIGRFERFVESEIAHLQGLIEAEAEKKRQRAKELKDIDSDIAFLKGEIERLLSTAEDANPDVGGPLLQQAGSLQKEKQDLETERAKL